MGTPRIMCLRRISRVHQHSYLVDQLIKAHILQVVISANFKK